MLGRRLVTTGNAHEAIQGQTRYALLTAKCGKCSRLRQQVFAPIQLYIQQQYGLFHKSISSSRISICRGVARGGRSLLRHPLAAEGMGWQSEYFT
jgi:hypothetical protein